MEFKSLTVNGIQHKIFSRDMKNPYTIAGAVRHDGAWIPMSWRKNGHAEGDRKYDLIPIPPLTRDDKVLVSYKSRVVPYLRRYVSHFDNDGNLWVYGNGRDSWSDNGEDDTVCAAEWKGWSK